MADPVNDPPGTFWLPPGGGTFLRADNLNVREIVSDEFPVAFTEPADLTVKVGSGKFVMPCDATLVGISAELATAPTGSAATFSIKRTGVVAQNYQFPVGRTRASLVSSVLTNFVKGDSVSIDITAIGSTVPGTYLTVTLFFRRVIPPTTGPRSISGLALWLKADETGGVADAAVPLWWDRSGCARNFIQNPSGAIYKTAIKNGLPVLRFTSPNTNKVYRSDLLLADASNAGAYTTFLVYSLAAADTFTTISAQPGFVDTGGFMGAPAFGDFSGPYIDAFSFTTGFHDGSIPLAGYNIWAQASVVQTTTDFKLRLNGGSLTTSTTGVPSNLLGTMLFGSDSAGAHFFSGDVGEIIMYNRALNDTERAAVESYLRTKWALP